jgi:hypothetical protein
MGSDGGRFALAILVIFGALVMFFFAFHPGGVEGVTNPGEMLQWLFGEFNNVTGNTNATDQATLSANTEAANYLGYTSTPDTSSDVGSAPTGSGVQVD